MTELVGMVASVVDNAPEELAADLNDAVCVLAGGGALISGLDKRLGDQLGIPVRVADAPLACAGAGLVGSGGREQVVRLAGETLVVRDADLLHQVGWRYVNLFVHGEPLACWRVS